jgi:crossover junction endodeoxyribonuclease RusA
MAGGGIVIDFSRHLKISIQEIPSSNNASQGKGGMKRAMSYQREKKLWAEWIWIMRNHQKQSGELEGWQLPLQEATIVLWYHFKTKARRDPDNYAGKMILDGLKEWGYIADDSFKEIDILPIADFGNTANSVEIYIIESKQLTEMAKASLRGGEKA